MAIIKDTLDFFRNLLFPNGQRAAAFTVITFALALLLYFLDFYTTKEVKVTDENIYVQHEKPTGARMEKNKVGEYAIKKLVINYFDRDTVNTTTEEKKYLNSNERENVNVYMLQDLWSAKNLRGITLFILGFLLSVGSREYFALARKEDEERKISAGRLPNQYDHIRSDHDWLLNFDLAKVHSTEEVNDSDWKGYIDALQIVTAGFEYWAGANTVEKRKLIKIFLFYPGVMKDIINLYKVEEVKKLHDKLIKYSNIYTINRFFLCTQEDWDADKNSEAEYDKIFKPFMGTDDKPYGINQMNIDISRFRDAVLESKGDLEFAVFEYEKEKTMCIGFFRGKITYVLIGDTYFKPYHTKLIKKAEELI